MAHPAAATPRWRRWPAVLAAVLLALAAGIAIGEWAGWPFLAGPLERKLTSMLNRRVSVHDPAGGADASRGFRIRFLGSVRASSPYLEIAAPDWSKAPHMVKARDVELRLRYGDIQRARRGEPLRIDMLHASALDANVERLADGRASWQFRAPPKAPKEAAPELPLLGRVEVKDGTVRYNDATLETEVLATLSLTEGVDKPEFKLKATGRYRKLPLKMALVSAGVLPWVDGEDAGQPVAVTLDATVGQATLTFKGSAVDAVHLGGLVGDYTLSGPSLAAAGDPLHVTLPTTPPFKIQGSLNRKGEVWNVGVSAATVGTSRLNGQFTFDATPKVPMLTGRLGGPRLMLVDLGPVVGTSGKVATAAAVAAGNPAAKAMAANAAAARKAGKDVSLAAADNGSPAPAAAPPAPAASAAPPPRPHIKGRLLPDRPFDLPSLRAMNADVQIDIAEVDLHTSWLQPLQPLRAHLLLDGGVLRLAEIDARTAQGRLGGELKLDGRGTHALWDANLNWSGVQIEHWVRQQRKNDAPPFVTGRLGGQARLHGQGRSTAEILGSLQGEVRTEVRDGSISHLAVEGAGLDLAQALGVMIKGDDALPMTCAVADLVAQGGVFKPRTVVVDTRDSALWVDGSLSLASESMDLRVVVSPKDFSPLTLRSPLRLSGSFADPQVTLDKGRLAGKVGTSLLLGLINPLAALIPLIDTGDKAAAEKAAAGCRGVAGRGTAVRAAAAAPPRR